MNRISFILVSTLALTAGGCANWFIHGGKIADRDYAKDHPSGYRLAGCTKIADGSPTPGGALTYHVVDSSVFERDENGKGALFQNHWEANDGDHYYAWVKQTGWEIILPKAPGPGAKRVVYLGASAAKQTDGSIRPTTQPFASCELEVL